MTARPNQNSQFDKISYTALGVAYARSLSDIPYCSEIADICGASALSEAERQVYAALAPYFEVRFKAINRLVARESISNVLELASGLSPRGLIMADDPNVYYIETDLPAILDTKKRLLAALHKVDPRHGPPEHLTLLPLNVLDEHTFVSVAQQFPPGPLAIIHEGLLAYFSHNEKKILAEIVHQILSKAGGVWITTDVFTRDDIRKSAPSRGEQDAVKGVLADTGRDYVANAFSTQAEAKDFFERLGFKSSLYALEAVAGEIASAPHSASASHFHDQLSLTAWRLTAV